MNKGEQIASSSIRVSLNFSHTADITEPFMAALAPAVQKLKMMR